MKTVVHHTGSACLISASLVIDMEDTDVPRKPRLVTICTACGREDVGVVIDWTDRDEADHMKPDRYRIARHKVKYLSKDRSVPYCSNSRSPVKPEQVFEHRG